MSFAAAPHRHALRDASHFGGQHFFCDCGYWQGDAPWSVDPSWLEAHYEEHVAAWRAAEAELDAL